jgi:hypothetical protein
VTAARVDQLPEETRALSATRARQLIGLPDGESVIDYRDRAILKTFLWSGIDP